MQKGLSGWDFLPFLLLPSFISSSSSSFSLFLHRMGSVYHGFLPIHVNLISEAIILFDAPGFLPLALQTVYDAGPQCLHTAFSTGCILVAGTCCTYLAPDLESALIPKSPWGLSAWCSFSLLFVLYAVFHSNGLSQSWIPRSY
jgi:hypothetical protein